ncbi:uncharacterized protein LACBIDRAFT_335093 [Laccaria bicolor S238N-H82]|uniref:Predicted protein n=1 Tax=Laccaria bicolor (strain S238N-H82 / ATCC MYA-4686) TaxID=486041 RepID=B0E1C3_LACBS|nr:uncharacterized protein LACBIDRAFT_335093 [Laccaria bicolor S238N-H82]EDQ99341.1 predicted protein [Laccaria bicolor S238N-H82]|eukprot:XP_001889987.1 predicted protein [Laccaria bicolor S238N-H82]
MPFPIWGYSPPTHRGSCMILDIEQVSKQCQRIKKSQIWKNWLAGGWWLAITTSLVTSHCLGVFRVIFNLTAAHTPGPASLYVNRIIFRRSKHFPWQDQNKRVDTPSLPAPVPSASSTSTCQFFWLEVIPYILEGELSNSWQNQTCICSVAANLVYRGIDRPEFKMLCSVVFFTCGASDKNYHKIHLQPNKSDMSVSTLRHESTVSAKFGGDL